MANSRINRSLFLIFSATVLVLQPILTLPDLAVIGSEPVYAQGTDPENETPPQGETETVDSIEDAPPEPADFQIETLDSLETFYEIKGRLKTSPDDIKQLKDNQVDIRVTDYLLQLVLPEEYGGYGFDHIKVNRIFKNYTSEGAGKYDREGVNATTDEDIISGHNRGQAVDISEVGSVTCKLVMKRHLGGSTTKWQKPLPVKVAWQSVEGAKNNPTPTAQSILGVSGEMSAQSILSYLNQSGEMDYYIEFVKGMDLKTIVGYVGANIYLKTFGVNQVLSDPFADGLLHALGGAALEKALPGLPAGLATGDSDEDARVAFAKSRVEQGLNLPAGSLKGYGWDNILQATGKRHLETSLGIPNGYFDKHTLAEALNTETIRTTLDHFGRSDDGLNLMLGTVDALKKKDEKGLKMAGVNILVDALKLPNDQRAILEQAINDKKVPNLNLDGVPAGNTIGTDDLGKLFSNDPKKQRELQDSFKNIGVGMVREAAKKAVKNKYSGLTNSILEDLLNPKKTVKLGDLTNTVGASTMGVQIGVDDAGLNKGRTDIKTFVTRHGQEIAAFINTEYNIQDPASQISTADLAGLFDGKNLTLAEKLGGVQVDKAFGWNAGSTFAVVKGDKKLEDAAQEMFANYLGKTVGLNLQGISLKGDIQENYGYAILSERLGIDQKFLKTADRFSNLLVSGFGSEPIKQKFRVISSLPLSELGGNNAFWDNEDNTIGWRSIDIALGTSVGTVRSYLRGEISTKQLARATTRGSLGGLTANAIYDYFGISDDFKLSETEITSIIELLTGTSESTLANFEVSKAAVLRLMGYSVDEQANFGKETFFQFITAPNSGTGTKLLLDQGLRMLTQSIGVNIDGYKLEDFETMAGLIKNIYNRGGTTEEQEQLERLRREYTDLKLIAPDKLTPQQRARINELERNGDLQSYQRATNGISDFFLNATNIPLEFRRDAEAFVSGDWRKAIAATSFAALLPQINKFMPTNDQYTYAEMRSAFVIDDPALISARSNQIAVENGVGDITSPNFENFEAINQISRRQLMEEAQKSIEYRMSDSLLRKIDPSIPVGFSRIMWSGTGAERGALLQNFALGHLDAELSKLSPLYVPGMLKEVYEGRITPATVDNIVLGLVGQSGISFGSFSNAFVGSFYQFIRAKGQGDFFTNTDKYGAMWDFFDGWLGETLNIGELPPGLAKSLYFTATKGWNINAELKNSQGVTLVASLESLGKDFLIGRLSSWGDRQFGLPVGKVYEAYKLYTAISGAEKAYAAAKATNNVAAASTAGSKVAAAKAALIMFAIELGLNACRECQKFFGSVDQAIAAPPGTTQMLVTGLIANAIGLGPAGLYMVAAIYLFGVYKVEYLCPNPPRELFGISEFDSAADQTDFGVPYQELPDDISQISGSPPLGQNPFDWDDTQPFTKGDNQKIWMSWARFYVGRLLDATLDYGEQRESPWKPLQTLAYRRANAEFFAPRTTGAFGDIAVGSSQYGLGYSQTTTKTTDWIHVGFGGLW